MDFLRIIGIALLTVIATLIVKQIKSEFAIVIAVAGGLIMLVMISDQLKVIVEYFSEIVIRTKIDATLFATILKIVGVGYLTEFSVSVCEDSGVSSLANKISFAGKVIILCLSLPIVTSLIDIIVEILP